MSSTQLRQQGFVIQKAENDLRDHLLKSFRPEFMDFCQTWDDLPKDPYLLDGGNYRHRRYSVFSYQDNQLSELPYEPHYQALHYNNLHGGFNRHLEPWLQETIDNPVLSEIIAWVLRQIGDKGGQRWRIQSHQFRIITSDVEQGKPTPEGIHKDGADYILIMLMQRKNIVGGESELYDNDRQPLKQGTLENVADLLLLDDRMVYHGVSDIKPIDASKAAVRDVLVLTFHQKVLEGIPPTNE